MQEYPYLKIPRNKLDINQVAKLMIDISTCDDPVLKAKLIAYNQRTGAKKSLKKTGLKKS